MAPEQFRGQAVLSTDLYGLGTTLLFLLTQQSPADLPQRKLKIDFRSHVNISSDFADWLEKTIEPIMEDRFPGVNQALSVLRGEQSISLYYTKQSQRPKYTTINLTQTDQNLTVEIPAPGLFTRHSKLFALIVLIWNGFSLLFLWVIFSSFPPLGYFGILLFLVIFPLIGVWSLVSLLFSAGTRTQIKVNPQSFLLERLFLSICYCKIRASTSNIKGIALHPIGSKMNKQPITAFQFRTKLRNYRFGTFLSPSDKEWLLEEIKSFISRHQ